MMTDDDDQQQRPTTTTEDLEKAFFEDSAGMALSDFVLDMAVKLQGFGVEQTALSGACVFVNGLCNNVNDQQTPSSS
jgi:hypothetical protein